MFGRTYFSPSFSTISVITCFSVIFSTLYVNANSGLFTTSPTIGFLLKNLSNAVSGNGCFLFIVTCLLCVFVLFTVSMISSSLGSIVSSFVWLISIPISDLSNPGTFPLCPSMKVYGPFT